MTVAEATPDYEIGTHDDRAFLGHPKGLGFLGFTEACERFSYYSMQTLLALVSRAAPPKINATMMGICFLVLFVANNLIGWIGTFYEQMTPLSFWLLHAGIAGAGAVLVVLLGPVLRRILEPREAQGLRPAAMTQEVER